MGTLAGMELLVRKGAKVQASYVSRCQTNNPRSPQATLNGLPRRNLPSPGLEFMHGLFVAVPSVTMEESDEM